MSGTTEPAAASTSNVANTTTLGTATSTQSSSFDSETKSILRSPKLGQLRQTTSSNQSVSTQSGGNVVPSSDNFGQPTTPTPSGISKNAVTSSTTPRKVVHPSVLEQFKNVTTSTSASFGGRYVQKPSCGFSQPAFGHQSIPVGQTLSSNQTVPGLAEINSLDTIFRGLGGKPSKEKVRSIQSGGSDVSNPGLDGSQSLSNEKLFGQSPAIGSKPKFGSSPTIGSGSIFRGSAFGGNPVGGNTFGSPQQSNKTSGGFERSGAFNPTFKSFAQSSDTSTFSSMAQQSAGLDDMTQGQRGFGGSAKGQTGFGGSTQGQTGFGGGSAQGITDFGGLPRGQTGFGGFAQGQTGLGGSTQGHTGFGSSFGGSPRYGTDSPDFGSDTNSSYGFRPEFTKYRSNMIIEQTPSSNQSVSRPTGFNPFKEKPNANVFKFTQSGVSDVTNPGHDGSPMGSIHKFGGGATFGGNPVGGSTFGTPQQSSNTSGGFEKSAELCPTFGSLALSSNTPIFGSTAQQSAGFSSSTQEQTGSDGSTQEQTKSGFGGDTNSSYGSGPRFTEYRS